MLLGRALLPCALRAAPRRRGFSIAVGSALGVRVLRKIEAFPQPPGSLRTSAHTGVAIRAPSTMLVDQVLTKGERIATPDDVGHWLAMTEKNPTLRNHSTVEFAKRRLFYNCYEFTALRAVQSSPWKQCGARHGRA